MINLEAIAKERYATYLREENDTTMANEYITSAYWLYQDWGAFGKVVELTQKFDFLKVSAPLLVYYAVLFFNIMCKNVCLLFLSM